MRFLTCTLWQLAPVTMVSSMRNLPKVKTTDSDNVANVTPDPPLLPLSHYEATIRVVAARKLSC